METMVKHRIYWMSMAFLALFACQKKAALSPQYDIWLPEELKQIFFAGPGSYWIMEGNSFGNVYQDSLYVTEVRFDTLAIFHPGSGDRIGRKEEMSLHFTSIWYGTDYILRSVALDYCQDGNFDEPCHFMHLERYDGDELRNSSRIFFSPAQAPSAYPLAQNGLQGPELRLEEIHPSLSWENQNFKRVYELFSERDFLNQEPEVRRFIAPGLGIIRWESPTITWRLLRAEIVN